MYNPLFFEMVSGSIAAERVAAAERQRSADAFAAGRSIRWTTRTTLLLPCPLGVCECSLVARLRQRSRGSSRPPPMRLVPDMPIVSSRCSSAWAVRTGMR
jgi:hypothetical protein